MSSTSPAETYDRLPAATSDLDQVKRDFAEFGYGLIKDCLGPEQIVQLRDRLVEQAAAECDAGKAHLIDGGRYFYGRPLSGPTAPYQLVRMLPNKGRVFRDLMMQPQTLEVMRAAFGELDFCLSNFTGIVTRNGVAAQVLHTDQFFLPDQLPRAWAHNIIYMLSEFRAENGATQVVPKSHLISRPRIDFHSDGRVVGHEESETVTIEGEPGTGLIFDGRLWHRGGPSRVPGPRLAISAFYAVVALRPAENYTACLHDDVYAQLDGDQLAMLGFKRLLTSFNYLEPAREGGRTNLDAPTQFTPEMQLSATR